MLWSLIMCNLQMADKNQQKKNKGVENNRKWRQGLLRNGGKEGKDKETRKKNTYKVEGIWEALARWKVIGEHSKAII